MMEVPYTHQEDLDASIAAGGAGLACADTLSAALIVDRHWVWGRPRHCR